MIWNLLAGTDNAGATEGGSSWGTVIMMIVVIVAIIGVFIWSSFNNKKKRKEAENMVNKLKVGDRVKTIGFVCGFVAEINDAENTFVLETGLDDRKSYIKFDKGAIYQTAPAQGNAVATAEKKVEDKPEVKEEMPATEESK